MRANDISGLGNKKQSKFADDTIFGRVGIPFRETLSRWKNEMSESAKSDKGTLDTLTQLETTG